MTTFTYSDTESWQIHDPAAALHLLVEKGHVVCERCDEIASTCFGVGSAVLCLCEGCLAEAEEEDCKSAANIFAGEYPDFKIADIESYMVASFAKSKNLDAEKFRAALAQYFS